MSTPQRRVRFSVALFCLTALFVQHARATWSIILVDTETKEIAIGSATCLENFNLERFLPVVVVGTGGACAQSLVDQFAQNRILIFNEFMNGTAPADMLPLLEAQDAAHQSRQYGIADTLGRTVTFTGSNAGAFASGVTGQQGTMFYAIQGNVLTGAPVVLNAEQAVLNTNGDLQTRLMAGMQAAKLAGGDGRCSCDPNNPTACGSPPAMFDKSAHVGFMLGIRIGDTDGTCNINGCATGDYYMNLNVPGQVAADPDPVDQLQTLFDTFHTGLIGVPDAVQSTVSFNPAALPPDGASTSTMTITLQDWQGTQLPGGGLVVTVTHDATSAGETSIGAVQDNGDGTYGVQLTAGNNPGTDRFRVHIDDGAGGIRPVVLTPPPALELMPLADGDFDGDGDVDLEDFAKFQLCFNGTGNPPAASCPPGIDADFDNDGDVDLVDFSVFQLNFTGAL